MSLLSQDAHDQMDQEQLRIYHSWLMKRGVECPHCSKKSGETVAEESPSPSQNPTVDHNGNAKGEYSSRNEKIHTVTRTKKDKRGYYVTETKTYIQPRMTETL